MMRCQSLAAVAALSALALTGCNVGPNYTPPAVSVNKGFDEARGAGPENGPTPGQPSVVTDRPVPVAEWWATFHDPEIDSLVSRAVKGNLDFRQAQLRLRQARAQEGVTGSDLFPTVDVGGAYSHTRGSDNVKFPSSALGGGKGGSGSSGSGGSSSAASKHVLRAADSGGSGTRVTSVPAGVQSPLGEGGLPGADLDLYQAGFDANWEIDIFGGTRRAIEAANAETQAAIEDRRAAFVTLLAEVVRDYVDLRTAQRRMDIARENLATQEDTLGLTKSRARVGLANDLDVVRQAAQVATTAAELPLIEAREHVQVHAIAVLLGEDPSSMSDELLAIKPLPAVPPEVPIGVPSDLLRRRPDIRRAERQLAASNARVGVAIADLFPRFSLTGSFGFDATKVKPLPNWDSKYYLISPAVSWPIFDAGRIRNNIEVQKSLQLQAATTYQQTVLAALREVEDSLVQYRTEQTRRKALADAVEASRQAVDLAKVQYTQGTIDFLEVLDTQRSLLAAEDSLALSDQSVTADLVSLYKALGGGWETTLARPLPG